MLGTLSCLNSQLLRAAAPKGVTPRLSLHISSRVSLVANIGGLSSRRSVAFRRFTATQAAYQDAPPQAASIGSAEWNKDLVNCVSLIGNLGAPLEVRNTTNSQVARGRLAVHSGGKDKEGMPRPPTWITIETWGPLAYAATELKKGEKIQVLGRMKVDEYTNKEGALKVETKVNVNQINRIPDDRVAYSNGQTVSYNNGQNNNQQTASWDSPPSQVESSQYATYQEDQTISAPWGADAGTPPPNPGEEKWTHLLQNMDQYFDNRLDKRSEKAPDFKLKGRDKNVALWLNSAPQWVHDELKKIPAPAPYAS